MPGLCGLVAVFLSWEPRPPHQQIEAVGWGSNNSPSVYPGFKRGEVPSRLHRWLLEIEPIQFTVLVLQERTPACLDISRLAPQGMLDQYMVCVCVF